VTSATAAAKQRWRARCVSDHRAAAPCARWVVSRGASEAGSVLVRVDNAAHADAGWLDRVSRIVPRTRAIVRPCKSAPSRDKKKLRIQTICIQSVCTHRGARSWAAHGEGAPCLSVARAATAWSRAPPGDGHRRPRSVASRRSGPCARGRSGAALPPPLPRSPPLPRRAALRRAKRRAQVVRHEQRERRLRMGCRPVQLDLVPDGQEVIGMGTS